ncbi:MAG: sulfatase-like hydrolase/transferase [Myxococcota bacterium]
MTLLLAALAGCGRSDPPPAEAPAPAPAAPSRPSLLLVTMDTTRADRIGVYGHERADTPVLDALAAEGIRFDQAFTTVPLTIPAHASIMTGRYPPSTGVRVNGDHALPDAAVTLAEVLQEQGWTTIGAAGAFVTTRTWAFDQGFDTFDDDLGPGVDDRWGLERTGPEVTAAIATALADAPPDAPVFVWAHLYDPHEPYAAPGIFASRGLDAYDSEIAFADAQVGRLRKLVERAAGPAGAAIIVVGDHGEGLGDDLERGHGSFLFDETLRVPLIVRAPDGSGAGTVVDGAVSVVDVLPTALGLLGVPAPDALDGVDLSAAARGEAVAHGPVYAESEAPSHRLGWAPEVVAIDAGLELFASPKGALVARDGGVHGVDRAGWQDLAAARPDDAARLRAFLTEVRSREPLVAEDAAPGLAAQQLEALGYVAATPADGAANPVVDAKDRADALHRLDEARHLVRRPGGRPDAEALWRSVIRTDPDIVEARLEIVSSLDRSGRRDEAFALLDEGIALLPDAAPLLVNRARLRLSTGDRAGAVADAERVLALLPGDHAAREILVQAAEPEAALVRIRGWQAEQPDDTFLHAMAGLTLVALGRQEEAWPELEAASHTPVPWLGVHRALGEIERRRGRTDRALAQLQAEVDHFPQDPPAWHALGSFQLERGDAQAASKSYDRVLGMYPADVVARRGLASAMLRLGDLQGAQHVLSPLLPSADPATQELEAAVRAARAARGG